MSTYAIREYLPSEKVRVSTSAPLAKFNRIQSIIQNNPTDINEILERGYKELIGRTSFITPDATGYTNITFVANRDIIDKLNNYHKPLPIELILNHGINENLVGIYEVRDELYESGSTPVVPVPDPAPPKPDLPTITLSRNTIPINRAIGLGRFVEVTFTIISTDATDENVTTELSDDFNSNAITVTLRNIDGDNTGIVKLTRTPDSGQGRPTGTIDVKVKDSFDQEDVETINFR